MNLLYNLSRERRDPLWKTRIGTRENRPAASSVS
jgi:hypothetical protein